MVGGVFCSFKNFVEMREICVSRGRSTAAWRPSFEFLVVSFEFCGTLGRKKGPKGRKGPRGSKGRRDGKPAGKSGRRNLKVAATSSEVSPGTAGLKAGANSTRDFGHADVLGDTEYVFCVIWSRIMKL